MNLITEVFGRAIKPLSSIGVGRLPGVISLYKFMWKHFGPKGIRLTETNGFKLYVICHDWSISPPLIYAHRWEPAETEICKQHIKEGMTVIDAGANVGYYTILISKLVGSKGMVYAFEPSPECLEVLRRNVQLNSCANVQVVGKAVTDKTGHIPFYLNPHTLSSSAIPRTADMPQTIIVPAVALDDVVGEKKVDFIKMDIEGAETRAFRGMTRIIKNNPDLKMIVEVFPRGMFEAGSSLEEFISFLRQYFRLHIIEKRGLTSEVELPDIQRTIRKTPIINLFCQRRRA